MREFVAPEHRISCSTWLWRKLIRELRMRSRGRIESGAFLLGQVANGRRRVESIAYYDDLDPNALQGGIVVFDGCGYGPLWSLCRESGRVVVADVHTHPAGARQSCLDRQNPMIATMGHVAIIVPQFALGNPRKAELGVYEYKGAHHWRVVEGPSVSRYLYIGIWG